jgi:exosortase/archaeosortase family protein
VKAAAKLIPSPEHFGKDLSGMTSRELLGWVIASFTLTSICFAIRQTQFKADASGLVIQAVDLIAWACAFLLILRDPDRRRASSVQIASVFALIGGAMFLPGRFGTIALLPLGLSMAVTRAWSDEQRRAGAILAAIAMQRLLARVIPILFGDAILKADTAAAGIAMGMVFPGSSWSGNTLKPPHDVGVIVGMPCSSFANLSFVMLCFVSLYAIDRGRPSWRAAAAIAGVCLSVIVINTARLILTARSLESFSYWHDGTGQHIFAVLLTIVSVTLCSLSSRWAAARR